MRKRILSILLTLCLCLSMLPAGAWAAEPDNDGLCPHHEEHNEACGYIEADEGAPCSHEHTEDCFAPVENCVHEHDEACGYAEPVEGVPCGFVCEICGETKEEEIEVYSEAEPDAMAVEADKLTVYDLDGDGTAENPYKISSREDLETIAVAVNGGNDLHGVYFEQTKDIDLEGDPWTVIGYVIGNTPHPFNGVYDGGN
ncbi:MAG: hypothetical protein J1E98_12005, partial [Lachnospiraceae bacterium]|nr:hypothetical protein [Lachnospiraceae bacterium]